MKTEASESSKDRLFARADQASREFNWELAIRLWAEYRAAFPDNMAGYVRAAQALGNLGRIIEAEAVIAQCVSVVGKHVWPAHCYADLAMITGNWLEAAKRWKQVQTDFPQDPKGYLQGIQALETAGWVDEASGLLEAAATKLPDNPQILECYAEFSMRRSNWYEAAHRWAAVRERLPDLLAGYTRGAQVLHKLGQQGKADDLLTYAERRFAAAGPAYSAVVIELCRQRADYEMSVENWTVAAGQWATMRVAFPNEVHAYVRGSTALSRLGRTWEASELITKAFERFPHSLWVAHAFAEAAAVADDALEVVQRWAAVRARFPNDSRGYVRGSEALIRSGQLPQAMALLASAASRFPNDVQVTLADLELNFAPNLCGETYRRWRMLVRSIANQQPRFYRLTWLLYLNRDAAIPASEFLDVLLDEKETEISTWLPQIVVGMTELLFLDFERFKRAQAEIAALLDRRNWQSLRPMARLIGVALGSRHADEAVVDGVMTHYLARQNRSLLGFMLSPELSRLGTGREFGFLDAVSRAAERELGRLRDDNAGPDRQQVLYNLLVLSYFGERPEYIRLRDSLGQMARAAAPPAQHAARRIHLALLAICSPQAEATLARRPALPARQRLRIVLCVSGQLRGYVRAYPSWRHLRLDGHDVTTVVHTWQNTGRKMPVGVHANRSFSGDFLTAFRTVAGNVDRRALIAQYPTFFGHFRSGQATSVTDVRAFYRTDHVVIEDDTAPTFASFSNPMKMYYKIAKSHQLATELDDFDLYLRIRPDKVVAEVESGFDWHEVARRSSGSDIAFCDRAPTIVPEGAFIIGDQFAAGSRHVMDVYSSVWSFCQRPETRELYGFPEGFSGHTNLAYTTLYQGVSVELLPGIRFEGPTDEAPLSPNQIHNLLSLDVATRTPSEIDRILLGAARRDMAAAAMASSGTVAHQADNRQSRP